MPHTPDSMKKQRDRFLAFAFASADLLLEISHEDRVVYAAGMTKSITGLSEQDIIGKNWLELFSPYEQSTIQNALNNTKPGKRAGPYLMNMAQSMAIAKAVVTGLKMPEDPHHYLTISMVSAVMEDVVISLDTQEKTELLDREVFIDKAQSTLRRMKDDDETAFLCLVDATALIKNYPDFSISPVLLNHSVYRHLAGEIGDSTFALVHNKSVSADIIVHSVCDALAAQVLEEPPTPDKIAEMLVIHALDSDLNTIQKKDTVWAVTQALNSFTESVSTFDLETLQDALDRHKENRAHRLEVLKKSIEQVSFNFLFQPVVDLNTMKEDHFEILCQFEEGTQTGEWLALAHEEHMHTDFDLAVMERVKNHIKFKEGGTTRLFSVNLFALSFQDGDFRERVVEHFTANKDLAKRLTFEIVNPQDLGDKTILMDVFSKLTALGFKVFLDNVPADIPLLKKLLGLGINGIKLDAQSLRSATQTAIGADIYRKFIGECKAFNLQVVSKGIETHNQLSQVRKMGVSHGQGYLFGRPGTKPVFNPDSL